MGWKRLCSCAHINKRAHPNPSSRAQPLRTWPLCSALSPGPLSLRGPGIPNLQVHRPVPATVPCRARCGEAGSVCGRAYLDSRFGEVYLQGQLLPGVDVRVVRFCEDPLQLFELRTSESGADAPLLALLVEAAVVGEEFVRNWGTTEGTECEQNCLERARRGAGMWGLQGQVALERPRTPSRETG